MPSPINEYFFQAARFAHRGSPGSGAENQLGDVDEKSRKDRHEEADEQNASRQ